MNDLQDFLAAGWHMLAEGVASAASPARYVTLATLGATGDPQARTVALRAINRDTGRAQFHTDSRSAKCDELRADARAALLVWDPCPRLQWRATGRVEQARDTKANWAAVPLSSRAAYGHQPPPGRPIATADAFDIRPDRQNFAVLILTIDEIDLVDVSHRDEKLHRRAAFHRQDGWQGQWLSP